MIAAGLILGTVLLGLRWPGLFVAAVFFGFPAGIFSGMSWLTTLAAALGICAMGLGFVTRRQRLVLTRMDLLFVLFLGLTMFSATWSAADMGFSALLRPLLPIVAVALLIRLVFAFGDPDDRIAEFFAGSMALGAVFSAYLIALSDGASNRFKLDDAGNIAVGITQAIELACLVGCIYLASARGMARLLALPVVLLTGQALLLTGTRGAFLAVMTGLAFYMVRLMGLRRLTGTVLLAAPVLLLLGSVLIDPAQLGALTGMRIFNFSSYGSSEDASSAIRLMVYAEAWEVFAENPLLGAGLGGFEALTGYPYPHNLLLELLTNGGLLLMVPVMGLVVQSAAAMADPRFDTPLRVGLSALLFSAVIHHQISFSLPSGKALFLFLSLPLLLAPVPRPAPARGPAAGLPAE